MEKRVFQHPMIKDKVTLIKTSEESNGEYLLVEVELAPGGGTAPHYHTSFTEEFIPVQGVLGLRLDKENRLVRPGRRAVAGIRQVHRFFNPGKTPIRFHVKISPAKTGFIDSLRIGYGLAEDGKTNKKGIPRNIDHLAILLELSDTRFTGLLSLIQPFLVRWARKARQKGVDKELFGLYCS